MIVLESAQNKDPVEIILEHINIINQQLDKIREQAERLIRSGERKDKGKKDAGR